MPTMPQNREFSYDVFLRHNAKDKAVVRPLAERLRADGLRPKAESQRLNAEVKSQPLAFGPQPLLRALGSDWAQLEAGTCGRRNLRFRDPLNPSYAKRLRAGRQARRFIPSRPDDAHDRNDCWRRKKARCYPAELGP